MAVYIWRPAVAHAVAAAHPLAQPLAAYSYAEAAATIVSPGSANATAALNLLKRCRLQERQDAAMYELLAEDAEAIVKEARAAATHALKSARRAALNAAGHGAGLPEGGGGSSAGN